jgi:crotonobetainyl-CoA:carnitine CoA-transferase CaiB-like acyl-CoA transferase
MRQAGLPLSWPGSEGGEHRPAPAPAPALGEHTAALLAELGYDGERADALRERNAG